MEIRKWLDENLLDYVFLEDNIFEIVDVGFFLAIQGKDMVFEDSFDLVLDNEDVELAEAIDIDFYCYEFGNSWFYTPIDKVSEVKLNPLKYLGKYKSTIGLQPLPHLGVHGVFDLLNGSGSYSQWIQKAKFFNVDTLGLVEKNTLGGALKFQLACQGAFIKPVIGMQIVVKDGEDLLQFKCYVQNKVGWRNLLLINKEINVLNFGFIKRRDFIALYEGLSIVVDPKYTPYEKLLPYTLNIENLYWQLDVVEFVNDEKDKDYLLNVQKYLGDRSVEPVLIADTYYLEKADARVKVLLNNISEKRDFRSDDQYFKSIEEIYFQLSALFASEKTLFEVFEKSYANAITLANTCQFTIELGKKHLPRYAMTEDQSRNYSDNKDLFYALIEQGCQQKFGHTEDWSIYLERIAEEVSVIELGGFVDYFLILWDIVNFAKSKNILRGIGRGSSGGSLVAYLLGITHINPLDYGLLFERFLNKGRIGKSLPDIDSDFPGSRRDEIKQYMESRYGEFQVCSVGTYTTLKMKAALKDLGRAFNLNAGDVNYITMALEDGVDYSQLFHIAMEKPKLKDFIRQNSELVENLPLILNQPRSKSIHACATLILPEEKEVFEWIPVRREMKNDQLMLVTEWEGGELEAAGFLKEDILGIKQLDKFTAILNLIKENKGEDVDIYSIPLDDEMVYILFRQGYTGDVFHFGSKGLTSYCKELQPIDINDLIAGIALYRPGAMENNFHNEYVFRKNGEREVEYLWGTETITKPTYGILVYQEQIMQVCSQVGGFSLVEADDVRKAMGKKKQDLLDSYKGKFLAGAMQNECPEDEALDLWEKLEKFAGYSFNKSHAAAYAITGYICQWLKVHYPIEFWTVAFDQADGDNDIIRYISEISDSKTKATVDSPDINRSHLNFTTDYVDNRILWSLSRVKQCGEETTKTILNERSEKGEFFSLEEFLDRTPKGQVNKAVVENLILAGAFDRLESIKKGSERRMLIEKFRQIRSIKVGEKDFLRDNESQLKYEWWWTLQQKNITGYGYFDYKKIIQNSTLIDKQPLLLNDFSIDSAIDKDLDFTFGGVVVEIVVKPSKKGEFAQVLLEHNYKNVWVVFWSEIWGYFKNTVEGSKGKILLVSGSLHYDAWKKQNVLQTKEWTEINILG